MLNLGGESGGTYDSILFTGDLTDLVEYEMQFYLVLKSAVLDSDKENFETALSTVWDAWKAESGNEGKPTVS